MNHETLWRLAACAAVANPFAEERDRLDRAMLGNPSGFVEPNELLGQLTALLAPTFFQWELPVKAVKEKKALHPLPHAVHVLAPEAPEHQKLAALFVLFHMHLPALDAVVNGETRSGLQELYGHLVALGSPSSVAQHQVALFVRMRRAYFLIAKAAKGGGEAMAQLRCALWNAIFTSRADLLSATENVPLRDFPVLFSGETGTGKSALARALGACAYIPFESERGEMGVFPESSFVAVNVNALSETLFESELFGHKKGAFTGAFESTEGVLGQCGPHSILFLDEIGDLPERQQTKLLEVLQERRYRPVGEARPRFFEGRVMAATHRNVTKLVATGRLREDFYYRLCSLNIEVPSLRRRLDEGDETTLPGLATALLESALRRPAEESTLCFVCDVIARDIPRGYPWPGNIRELEQVVRGVLLTGKASVEKNPTSSHPHLESPVTSPSLAGVPVPNDLGAIADALVQRNVTLRDLEEALVQATFRQEGTYERAGRKLGLDWRTVKKWVAKESTSRKITPA